MFLSTYEEASSVNGKDLKDEDLTTIQNEFWYLVSRHDAASAISLAMKNRKSFKGQLRYAVNLLAQWGHN